MCANCLAKDRKLLRCPSEGTQCAYDSNKAPLHRRCPTPFSTLPSHGTASSALRRPHSPDVAETSLRRRRLLRTAIETPRLTTRDEACVDDFTWSLHRTGRGRATHRTATAAHGLRTVRPGELKGIVGRTGSAYSGVSEEGRLCAACFGNGTSASLRQRHGRGSTSSRLRSGNIHYFRYVSRRIRHLPRTERQRMG